MKQSEAVAEVARRTSLTEAQVGSVLNNLTDVLADVLAGGESFTIRRFGRFEPRLRRPLAEGKPEKASIAFVPSEVLKERLNDA